MIRATIRANQKCFVLKKGEGLANRFILVSNLDRLGWRRRHHRRQWRVIRARLSDAKFFYETDLAKKLEDRLPKLSEIVFHAKLGTQASASSASSGWRPRSRRWSAPMSRRRSAPRSCASSTS